MRKNLFAAAAAVLILLGSTTVNATRSHDGPAGADAENVHGDVNRVSVSIKNLAFNSNQAVQADANANKNKSENDNRSRNVSGSSNTNANTNSSSNGSKALATSSATSSATSGATAESSSSGSDGGSTSVSADGEKAPASGAAPVYITTSDDTCMGSSGAGGQGDVFGFSIGSTWTDSNCIMLKNARELNAQGHSQAAKARLCMNEDNAMAFELAGDPCPRQLASTQAALAKIHAAQSGDLAAAQPSVQIAALGDAGDRAAAGAAAAAAGDAPQTGDLLAMVQSVAHHIADAFSSQTSSDFFAKPYPMDGIE